MSRLVIAIVLLLIPATELLKPGTCIEELEGLPPVLAKIRLKPTSECAQATLALSSPCSDQTKHSVEDDCFCCSHQIVPPVIFVPGDDDLSVHVRPDAMEGLLSPAANPPDHPPQFS